MQYDFQDKVALITGGCSGIGLASAKRFAECGARIALLDKEISLTKNSEDLLNANGSNLLTISGDVSSEEDIENAINLIVRKFGRLDFAFNSAGVGGDFALVENYPTSDWDSVMNVNLKGTFLSMKHEIPAILKSGGGAIVNCASVLSTVASENDSAYVASKFAVLGLTKNAALEYASTSLRINSISPGFTRTPMIDKGDEQKLERIASKHPIGRLGKPEEIANGVMWLCSDQATFAVGLNLLLDGGYTLQ
jgi:NAD(P)-dependent dehydrogenase (short-subunit alcohol dehydrogenase family)